MGTPFSTPPPHQYACTTFSSPPHTITTFGRIEPTPESFSSEKKTHRMCQIFADFRSRAIVVGKDCGWKYFTDRRHVIIFYFRDENMIWNIISSLPKQTGF